MFCAVSVRIFVFWCCYVWCCVWWSCYIIPIVLLCFLLSDIYYILLFIILSSTEKIKAKRIMCVILLAFYIKCVVCCRVHLWTVILLYLLLWSAVVSVWCSLSISTSYRGFAISPCCLVGWSEAYKLFAFWQSQVGILFIVLCVLLLCCLCCLLWKCVKYQDIGETYPRVVYISVEGACGV